MKKIAIVFIIIITMTGCRSNNELSGEEKDNLQNYILELEKANLELQSNNLKSKTMIEEEVVKLNNQISELENENFKLLSINEQLKTMIDDQSTSYIQEDSIFEPHMLKIGDIVAGFVVTDVRLDWDGHDGTYYITFAGNADISGSYINHLNNHIAHDKIEFTLDNESQKRIPIPKDFNSIFFVENYEVFEKVYGEDESGNIAMNISGLTFAISRDKHITNRITFLNISPRSS